MHPLAIQLTLHGAIVLLIGLLTGIPYGHAITRKPDENTVRAWRVAHSGLAIYSDYQSRGLYQKIPIQNPKYKI